MIGKIMSEASHSIIGMLSAKPLDMETGTANNEFSSHLMTGEDPSRLTLDNSGVDIAGDDRGAQFLDQLIGSDDQPVLSVNDRETLKTISAKISVDRNEGDIELHSATQPSSVSASETERFLSTLPPSPVQPTSLQTDSPLSADASPVGRHQSGISTDQSGLVNRPLPPRRDPLPADVPTSDPATDKPGQELGDVAKIASIPLIFVDGPKSTVGTETNADIDQKPTATIHGQKAPVVADKLPTILPNSSVSEDLNVASTENKQPVESKSPASFKPLIESKSPADSKPVLDNGGKAETTYSSTNNPVRQSFGIDMPKPSPAETIAAETIKKPSEANTPIKAKPYSDADVSNLPKAGGMNAKTALVSATPLAPAMPQDANSGRKIRDSLYLRLANKSKIPAPTSRQTPEFEVGEATVVANKSMKIEAKLPFVEMENLPAAGHLERNTELSLPAHSTPAIPAQNITPKTVSFDWNAPQFAERFASEMSDLTINGDLKKFEINPRNMGRLEVSFISRGGAEIIQIGAENDAAREMIVQHSQAIQDMLKAQGRSDLTLRVDVRENMLFGPQQDSMNFDQQDSASAREERAAPSKNRGSGMPTEVDADPQGPSDNSRYA